MEESLGAYVDDDDDDVDVDVDGVDGELKRHLAVLGFLSGLVITANEFPLDGVFSFLR